jgi:hypothetical protein
MKKLLLLTFLFSLAALRMSFGMGTKIICNDGVAVVENLKYYTDTSKGKETFKHVNIVKIDADNYAAKKKGNEKVLSVAGAHVLLGILTQNLEKTEEESEEMVDGVMALEELGYKPVSTIIGVAKELLKSGKGKRK